MNDTGVKVPLQSVLVVEDEYLVALVLATDLEEAGYGVVGPYFKVETALEAIESQSFDVALLDINLNGQLVYPVADILSRRKIPFIFLTGYAARDIPEPYRSCRRVAKPINWDVVLGEIKKILAATMNEAALES